LQAVFPIDLGKGKPRFFYNTMWHPDGVSLRSGGCMLKQCSESSQTQMGVWTSQWAVQGSNFC